MFTLHALFVMIGGGLDEGLALVIKELGVIREQFPDVGPQVDALVVWLRDMTNGQWTDEALRAQAEKIIGLFSGKGWGPPNPGSIAGV